jgi:hypothetical protein
MGLGASPQGCFHEHTRSHHEWLLPNVVQWIFRYLRGTSKACLKIGKTSEELADCVNSDFDVGSDKRRPITGYVFTIGGCVMRSKVTLQPIVA